MTPGVVLAIVRSLNVPPRSANQHARLVDRLAGCATLGAAENAIIEARQRTDWQEYARLLGHVLRQIEEYVSEAAERMGR